MIGEDEAGDPDPRDEESTSGGESIRVDPNDPPADGSAQTGRPDDVQTPTSFDWRGWFVVAIVFVSVIAVPLFVLFIPEMHWLIGRLGFSQRQAYIVFPMIPAILLGITAVWATLRSLDSDR